MRATPCTGRRCSCSPTGSPATTAGRTGTPGWWIAGSHRRRRTSLLAASEPHDRRRSCGWPPVRSSHSSPWPVSTSAWPSHSSAARSPAASSRRRRPATPDRRGWWFNHRLVSPWRSMSSDGPTHWGSIAVGTPTTDFEPRPPDTLAYRPDTIADGWSTGELTVRLASVRGYAHRYAGLPRQDDVAVVHHPGSGTLVFAIADGVSAAPLAHLGATAACRAAVTAITGALDTGRAVDWPTVMEHAAWQVVEQTAATLHLERPDPGRAEQEMATTLIAGL